MNRRNETPEIVALSNKLKTLEKAALDYYSICKREDGYTDDITIQSLHGTIGGKGSVFVDLVNMSFVNFEDYYSRWKK